MKKILFIVGLVSTMLLAACSSEESVVKEDSKVNVAKGITFQFIEEDYIPGVINNDKTEAKGTRAMQLETVDLGNGLVAELSIEPDTMGMAKTRAPKPIPNGHYTIYALDASNVRHDGLKGTVTGGSFIPDTPTEWNLNPGETYTFVCFNDLVEDMTSYLIYVYDRPSLSGYRDNPLLGVTTHTVSNTEHDVVTFTMRHLNARVRYQITSYTEPCIDGKITVTSSDSPGTYGEAPYNLDGTPIGDYGFMSMQFPMASMTPNRTAVQSSIVETYTASTDYLYYPSSFDFNSVQYATVQGTLYGKTNPFTASIFTHIKANTILQKNHSYVFNWKVKSKDPLYLFHDGTVGYLGSKGTHTPIGVVAREKTKTTHGIAVALKDADNNMSKYTTPYNAAKMNTQHNTTHYTDANDAVNDLDGYKWTHEAAGSVDGRIKANEAADYTPFYQAANYNPGVTATGSNIGKWYVPAFGEWCLAWKAFGRWNGNFTLPSVHVNIDYMNEVFIAAGGTAIKQDIYWNSTEYAGQMRPVISVGGPPFGVIAYVTLNATHNVYGYVRPFVHF